MTQQYLDLSNTSTNKESDLLKMPTVEYDPKFHAEAKNFIENVLVPSNFVKKTNLKRYLETLFAKKTLVGTAAIENPEIMKKLIQRKDEVLDFIFNNIKKPDFLETDKTDPQYEQFVSNFLVALARTWTLSHMTVSEIFGPNSENERSISGFCGCCERLIKDDEHVLVMKNTAVLGNTKIETSRIVCDRCAEKTISEMKQAIFFSQEKNSLQKNTQREQSV